MSHVELELEQGTGRINWSGEILIPALKMATESSSPFLLHCLLLSIAPSAGAPTQERWGHLGTSPDEVREMLRWLEHLCCEAARLGVVEPGEEKASERTSSTSQYLKGNTRGLERDF